MTPFQPQALEESYAFLDDLPEALLPAVVTARGGSLLERVRSVLAWREALLAGRLPTAGPWPAPVVATSISNALESLGILRFCSGNEDLVDALLPDLLAAFQGAQEVFEASAAARLRELEALERKRLAVEAKEKKKATPREVTDLCLQAAREAAAAFTHEDATLASNWAERVRVWTSLAEVFGELGDVMGLGWDLSHGVLQHAGWRDLARLRALLENIEPLKALVRTLGRLHDPDEGPPIIETITEAVRRVVEELHEVRTPQSPAEARGVERSAAIARMLPAEAALLHHPLLRLVWHARRAEQALMTYRVEGVVLEPVFDEVEEQTTRVRERPRPLRGPIIICLDTSGSMAGVPENVAKAVTLECLRVAHAEGRACHLYAFSGPRQVVEHTLDLSPKGIGGLLGFLTSAFHGGTDVAAPLQRALARLETDEWRRADLLLVSDGEFPVAPATREAVRRAQAESALRVHGLLIGSSHSEAMAALCDPLHHFRDWHALGRTTLPANAPTSVPTTRRTQVGRGGIRQRGKR
ncbi:MAG: VWA domain-containing protein [Myxococcales bacterium]|nr:VWA domain-containing protein [Myxococcales bacterium]